MVGRLGARGGVDEARDGVCPSCKAGEDLVQAHGVTGAPDVPGFWIGALADFGAEDCRDDVCRNVAWFEQVRFGGYETFRF